MRCYVSATYGPHEWPLPVQEVSFPQSQERYKHFAKALLAGEVLTKLKPFEEKLLNRPAIMCKSWTKVRVACAHSCSHPGHPCHQMSTHTRTRSLTPRTHSHTLAHTDTRSLAPRTLTLTHARVMFCLPHDTTPPPLHPRLTPNRSA